jgi:hypothetical protein
MGWFSGGLRKFASLDDFPIDLPAANDFSTARFREGAGKKI